MMKIVLCHNHYQQPGGEDQVFADEAALLQAHGHQVLRLTMHNDEIQQAGKVGVAARTFWNQAVYRRLRTLLERERPAVVHCTNLFPLLSPAIYYACRAARTPVVHSLHNYRLICPAAQLLRDGRVCEACVGATVAWRAVVHSCYRHDRAASAVVAGMTATHRLLGTWTRSVDRYIALSEFSRQRFIAGGLPAERIVVKRNFVDPDPGMGDGAGGYVLFAGRLSQEKGIDVLLDAWRQLKAPVELRIAGDGPFAEKVQAAASADRRIRWLGRRSPQQVIELMSGAALLAMPSIWYEACPKTLIEAFSVGTPVVASRLGAMAEMIDHGATGWLFEPGDASRLALSVERTLARPAELAAARRAARGEYLARYTAQENYRQLIDIYAGVGVLRSEMTALSPQASTTPVTT